MSGQDVGFNDEVEINSFAVDHNEIELQMQENVLERSHETSKYPRVNLWLAYPHYGIGYLLSNGSIGELMPDKTSLFYSPCRKRMLYNSHIQVAADDLEES